MLDALLESSNTEVQQFDAVMKWMYTARKRHGNEGSLSQLVVEIDRVPLCRFLSDNANNRGSRAEVLSLLTDIWEVFSINPTIKRNQSYGFLGR